VTIKQLALDLVRQDGNTQPRTSRHVEWCEDYALDIAEGRWDWSRPGAALTVFFDGTSYWLADGFHRRDAAEIAGLDTVACDVRKGSQRDAQLFSCSANAVHGHRRTNDDKRRAVEFMLADAEWSQWSDSEIARRCVVSTRFVGIERARMAPPPSMNSSKMADGAPAAKRTATRNGKTYAMDTSNIGKAAAAPPSPPTPPARDDSGDFIHSAISSIVEMFARLPPDADDAAARYPIDLAYGLRVQQVRAIGEWLIAFADTFGSTREAARVRYIENAQREARRHGNGL
jgi:hypothetical protein